MTDNAKSPILSKNVSSSIGLEPPLRFPGFEDAWERKKLEKICSINPSSGKLPAEFYYIDLECVVNGEIVSQLNVISRANAPSRAQRVLSPDDVLYQTVRPYQKNNFFFKQMLDLPAVASTGYAQIRGLDCSIKFIYHLLHTDKFVLEAMKRSTGTSYPAISSNDLAEIDVCYPTRTEQQKIADFLSLVDERIEKQRQLVEVFKRYKRGLFSSIYSAKQLNWKSVCVGDFSKVYGGYAFDSKKYSESGKYNVLTIGNVSGNRYADIESCNAVEEMPVDIQQYQILQPDDLVVSMTGNVGRVSIVNQDDCLLNQRVAKLDIKDSTIREYVYQVLSCSKFEQEMNNVGQGAAQKNIKNSDIENFIFYIPENNTELNTLARLFLGLDNIILKQEQQLAKLMQSKQSLLQQMFI